MTTLHIVNIETNLVELKESNSGLSDEDEFEEKYTWEFWAEAG